MEGTVDEETLVERALVAKFKWKSGSIRKGLGSK